MTDMDKETEAALRESIKHWEENVAGETPDDVCLGTEHCALCEKYFLRPNCSGCPVSSRTGFGNCDATPYEAAADAFECWESTEAKPEKLKWRVAAQAELDFLKSLLPASSEEQS